MSQLNTFFIPLNDTGERQAELNVFLRGHRALQIERAFADTGWAFCVEWLGGRHSRRTGFVWRTGTEDAAGGDGEQENGICLENGNQGTRRGETGNRRTGLGWRTGTEDEAGGRRGTGERDLP